MRFCVIAFFYLYSFMCESKSESERITRCHIHSEQSFITLIYFDYTKHGVPHYYYYYSPRTNRWIVRIPFI